MSQNPNLKETLIRIAKENDADLCGFAPAARFPADDPIFRIMPDVKTVMALGFRVLRGCYRGIEEGSTFYQYTTMGVETVEETVMPMALLRVCNVLEEAGFWALPQKNNQTIMAEEGSVNPEVGYSSIYGGIPQETQMNFRRAAVLCGVGEEGLHGAILTDEFGPMVRFCFILTDAELPGDPVYTPHLCDKCGACVKGCPGHAIAEDGTVDPWTCAVYYNGACGKRNPFMPADAYAHMDDRIAIIAGEAKITPEKARQILEETVFYPPAKQCYPCSICGRMCDVDCYVHLEEKGVLTRTFRTPFRKREKWEYPIEDFT